MELFSIKIRCTFQLVSTVEALCSLSDARGALMLIAAAVKSIQSSHRAQYFADTRFVEQWMRAAIPLIARWNEIQEYITQ